MSGWSVTCRWCKAHCPNPWISRRGESFCSRLHLRYLASSRCNKRLLMKAIERETL